MNKFLHKYGIPCEHFNYEKLPSHIQAKNLNLDSDEIDKHVSSPDIYTRVAVASNPNLQPHHIDSLISRNQKLTDYELAGREDLSREQISTIRKRSRKDDKDTFFRLVKTHGYESY